MILVTSFPCHQYQKNLEQHRLVLVTWQLFYKKGVCLVPTLVLTLFQPSFLEFLYHTGPNQFSLNRTQNHSNLIGKYIVGSFSFQKKMMSK